MTTGAGAEVNKFVGYFILTSFRKNKFNRGFHIIFLCGKIFEPDAERR